MTLVIKAIKGHRYEHRGISNLRESKNELRWTNARGEKRSMALCFITTYEVE